MALGNATFTGIDITTLSTECLGTQCRTTGGQNPQGGVGEWGLTSTWNEI